METNAVAFMFYLQFLVEIFYLFICFSWKGEYTGILFPNLCREEQDPDPRNWISEKKGINLTLTVAIP